MPALMAACVWIVFSFAGPAIGAEQGQGPTTLSNLWTMNIKGRSDSTPAIGADGTIYFGTFAGRFWAIAPNGAVEWSFDTKRVARANMEIRSSPAVDDKDGTIYFGCRDNRLYALTPRGGLKWTFETGAWVDSSPAIGEDGTVYAGSWDKNLYAIEKTGAKKWQFATGGEVVSSPAIGKDGTVYFGSHDGKFYAVNTQGTKAWEYAAGGPIISSPAIGGDGVVYFTSVNGYFHAMDAGGTLRWKLQTGGITESSPVIGRDGTIYVGVNNKIWAISKDGKQEWEQLVMGGQAQDLVQATPVALEDGGLYVMSRFGMLYRWDGKRKAQTKFYLYGSGYGSPSLNDNGNVYVTGTWTNLHALNATTKPAQSAWPRFRGDQGNRGRAR